MLAVVLAGIGLGAVVSGAIHLPVWRDRICCCPCFCSRCDFNTPLLRNFSGEDSSNESRCFRYPFLAADRPAFLALTFPVALISGTIFPLIAARVQTSVGDRMNSTGLTTLFNTSGAALGLLLASFFLLPTWLASSGAASVICCQLRLTGHFR